MNAAGALSAGDLYGFVALLLVALAAILMLLRSKLLKMTRSLGLIRNVHVMISTSAGVFLVLHISSLYLPPSTAGILLGYAAIVVSVVLWLTGAGFLVKIKDSLFFHGVLSGVFIPLAIMHAAISSPNIAPDWSRFMVAEAGLIVFANAALQMKRAASSRPGR